MRDDRRVTRPAPDVPAPDALPTVAPVDDVLVDLEWRGLVAQTTDREALARDLADGPLTLYCGFDPTAESLHVGSLVPLLALRRFQLAGHRPIALAGGATGFIGDPTGRTSERTMMTPEVVAERTRLLGAQMQRFLDFGDGPSAAVLVDNYEWTAPLGVLEFLRDVGAHFPVNQMLARESVSARLESGGLSFTEFSYQLLQSMDYVELFRRLGCRLQIGGNDQWGNITAGLDLLRRVERGSGHALTFPLVTDARGRRSARAPVAATCGSTPAMTSPYALYQFALNVDDRDAGTYLRLLTFVGREEVEALDAASAGATAGPGCAAPPRRRARGAGARRRGGRCGCKRPARRCSAAARSPTSTSRRWRRRWRRRRRSTVVGGRSRRRGAARRGSGAVALGRPPRGQGGRGVPEQRQGHRRGVRSRGGGLAARPLPGARRASGRPLSPPAERPAVQELLTLPASRRRRPAPRTFFLAPRSPGRTTAGPAEAPPSTRIDAVRRVTRTGGSGSREGLLG